MHRSITNLVGIIALTITLPVFSHAQEAKEKAATEKKCPISGEAIDPDCKYDYEGKTYLFCCGKCLKKFKQDRAESLYEQIGGKAAINAAVDLFYKKVLADDRVNHFFEDVNMKRQHSKQKAFLSAALGGPEPWEGKDMRKAHSSLDLNAEHFGAIAEHLQATLEELKVDKELIGKVMAVVASTKGDVLNEKAASE